MWPCVVVIMHALQLVIEHTMYCLLAFWLSGIQKTTKPQQLLHKLDMVAFGYITLHYYNKYELSEDWKFLMIFLVKGTHPWRVAKRFCQIGNRQFISRIDHLASTDRNTRMKAKKCISLWVTRKMVDGIAITVHRIYPQPRRDKSTTTLPIQIEIVKRWNNQCATRHAPRLDRTKHNHMTKQKADSLRCTAESKETHREGQTHTHNSSIDNSNNNIAQQAFDCHPFIQKYNVTNTHNANARIRNCRCYIFNRHTHTQQCIMSLFFYSTRISLLFVCCPSPFYWIIFFYFWEVYSKNVYRKLHQNIGGDTVTTRSEHTQTHTNKTAR